MRHLSLYRALRVVVDEGSIRKAAEIIGISPSALNRRILSFEEDLGTPFFERMPNGVRLAVAGEIYYRHIIKHLDEFERDHETIAKLTGASIGHVDLAVSRGLETGWVPHYLARARGDAPGLTLGLRMLQGEAVSDVLEAGQADLALAFSPDPRRAGACIGEIDVPLVGVIAANGDGADPASGLSPHELADFDLILPPADTTLRRYLDDVWRRNRLGFAAALEAHVPVPPYRANGRGSLQILPLTALVDGAPGVRAVALERLPPIRVELLKQPGRTLDAATQMVARDVLGTLRAAMAGAAA